MNSLNNYKELSITVADIVAKHIIEWPVTNIALPTGSTPIGMYEELVKKFDLEWTYVKTFNLDEYIMNPDHEQSYHSYMKNNFYGKIDIMPSQCNFPDRNTEAYEKKMRNMGGIDLCILGLGTNGHIAFNEPGSDFKSRTRVVDLTEQTIVDNSRFFDDVGDVPTQAITMGLGTIMDSKRIILIVSGEQKLNILNVAMNAAQTIDIPASVLQEHDNLEVYYCD
jgi:glucosamine-6-phosphate deaminase